jgi:hypothetical protein
MVNRLSKDDFKVIMASLKSAYPNWSIDQHGVNLWYSTLQDIPYPTLNKAALNYVMTHKFAPTIADLRELSYRLSTDAPMLAPAAWNQLIRALRQAYSPDSEMYWEQLPDLTKKIVGGYTTFRQWGNTSLETLESVQRPMFLKRFEEYQRREMMDKITPISIRPPQTAIPETPQRNLIEERKSEGVEAPEEMLRKLKERLKG